MIIQKMPMRLLTTLAQHAAVRPDAPAYIRATGSGTSVSTYGQLHNASLAFAAELSSCLDPGDVMLLSASNDERLVIAFLAGMRVGASVFLLSPDMSEPERTLAIRRAKPRVALASDEVAEHIQSAVEKCFRLNGVSLSPAALSHDVSDESDQAQVLLQTSGTTATPKIICRTSASLDAVASNTAQAVGMTSDDRVLGTVPLCHSYGMEHGLLAPLYAGASVHLLNGFVLPAVQQLVNDGDVSIFPGVPFMYEALAGLTSGECQLANLRRAYSASAPLPMNIFNTIEENHGLRVTQLYGATEIGSVAFNAPGQPGFDPSGVGKPMQDVDIRIVSPDQADPQRSVPPGEQGHVIVSAPSMLQGYLDEPLNNVLNGYFLTGDLGHLDVHGVLFVTGRLKLLIDIGGRKVNPLEVEHVLKEHQSVDQCAVVAFNMTQTVRRLKAFVTLKPDAPPATPDELRLFARDRVSSYKAPRVVEICQELPMSPAGKIMRHLLESE